MAESDMSAGPPHAVRAPRWWTLVIAGAVCVGIVTASVVWWRVGGTHLAASGAGFGLPVADGMDASFGIVATKADDGRLRLDSVSANVSEGASITWSVYQAAPGALGFGSWNGPLAPRWPTVPVAGYDKVSTGDLDVDGSTWVVGTVHADAPGVYRVSDVSIDYHSGWHSRTVSSQTTVCVLAYPSGSTYEGLVAAADPLIAQYNDCEAQR